MSQMKFDPEDVDLVYLRSEAEQWVGDTLLEEGDEIKLVNVYSEGDENKYQFEKLNRVRFNVTEEDFNQANLIISDDLR